MHFQRWNLKRVQSSNVFRGRCSDSQLISPPDLRSIPTTSKLTGLDPHAVPAPWGGANRHLTANGSHKVVQRSNALDNHALQRCQRHLTGNGNHKLFRGATHLTTTQFTSASGTGLQMETTRLFRGATHLTNTQIRGVNRT